MSDRPQLSLGQPPETLQKKLSSVPRGWLFSLVLLHFTALSCLAVLLSRTSPSSSPLVPLAPAGSAQELKAVATNLEDKSLDAEAARVWEAYLAADPECPERAEILYRIGGLYMQAEQFGPAAAALVRAEQAAGDNRDLTAKIGPRMVECLGRLGRYGEVGRELSRRTEVGGKTSSAEQGNKKVLATLTGQNFTEADLDRMIERRVDRALAMQGSADPQQRQAILQQMSAPAVRRQLLEEILKTELFCRRGRELGLDREEGYRQARDQLAQNLLAERFLARELEKVRPTEVDLESYFKANLPQYETPESLQVIAVRIEPKEESAAVLGKIKSADDFRKWAASRQPAGMDLKAASRQIARGQKDAELGDVERLFALAEGEWTREPHVRDKDRFLVLVEKKTPRHTPQLQEVLERVRADYVGRKQQELAEKLFADLTQRYDVHILPDAAAPAAGDKSSANEERKR
ncbi:MAG: peptidyl-prolyl cis-trans isomerase [Thermoguttaceae bacterium]